MTDFFSPSAPCDRSHRSTARWYSAIGTILCGAIVLGGCSGDTSGNAPIVAPDQLFLRLQLNYEAINLALVAPYDTVRLVATPLDAAGHVMTDLGRVTFRSADSTVTVDSTGLITAHYLASLTSPTYVTAELTVRNVTRRDTAWIQVVRATDPHVPLATFSMQPVNGDSAKVAWGLYRFIPTLAIDSAGGVMFDAMNGVNNLLVRFVSSNTTTATINKKTGELIFGTVGSVTFYAATYAYGVAARDSLAFVIGYPITVFTDDGGVANYQAICGDTAGTAGGIWHLVYAQPDPIYIGAGGQVRIGSCGDGLLPSRPAADTLTLMFDDTGVVKSATNGARVSSTGDTLIIPKLVTKATITARLGMFHWRIGQYGGISGTIVTRP